MLSDDKLREIAKTYGLHGQWDYNKNTRRLFRAIAKAAHNGAVEAAAQSLEYDPSDQDREHYAKTIRALKVEE